MCIRIICDASKNAIQNILVQQVWSTLKNLNLIHSPDDSEAQTTLQSKTVENLNDKMNKANLIDIEQYA